MLPGWVRISQAVQVAAEVRACRDLDSGESEALSLALELHADAVLMDDAAGRRAVMVLKLPFVGVAGVAHPGEDGELDSGGSSTFGATSR